MLVTHNEVINKLKLQEHTRKNDKHVQRFVDHSTKNPMVRRNIEKAKPQTSYDVVKELKNKPVCPMCETIAFRDKGWETDNFARCPSCGWSGRTVTMDEYLESKCHR